MRFLGVVLLGCALSLAFYEAWELDTRWFVVVVVAIAAVAVSMCLVRIFSDFLLVVSLFCMPLSSFSKWFWPGGYSVETRPDLISSGLVGLGPIDFILVGLYLSWFYRVVVSREQSPLRLNRLDFLILWFVVAYLLASIGSEDAVVSLSATEFLVKHVLFYFYLSRNLEERHLPWMLAAFAFTIFLEAALGSYQFTTGRLIGIALDKGAGSSTTLTAEYVIPGTEGYHRATGTCYDSHILGHLLGIILAFPLVLFLTPRLRPVLRLGCMAAAGTAVLVILESMSRSAWLGSAIAVTIGIVLIITVWQERQVVPALAIGVVLVAAGAPFIASFVYARFANSPVGTLTLRLDQYVVAWDVLTHYPLFGVGPGNWINVFPHYDFLSLAGNRNNNMVHNVILWLATEVGIFGLTAYLGTVASAMLRLFALARRRRDIAGRFALAALIGLIITVLNGLAEPGFRSPDVFMMFWILVALSVALPRLRPGAGEMLLAPALPGPGLAVAATAAGGRSGSDG